MDGTGWAATSLIRRFWPEMSLGQLRRELAAGMNTALVALPVCISSGVLAYAPLGGDFIAKGAAAGLTGGALSAIMTSSVAGSTFVMSSPRASISVIQASLAAFLVSRQEFASTPQMIIDTMSLCGLLAGLWQMLFGVLGLDRIIKCTPYPALAGFVNGIALLVITDQLALLFGGPTTQNIAGIGGTEDVRRIAMPIFAVIVVGLILLLANKAQRVPSMIVGIAVGSVLFYGLDRVTPSAALGPTVGMLGKAGGFTFPYVSLVGEQGFAALGDVVPALLISSLVLALVSALESLLAFRAADDLTDRASDTARNVLSQGVGNFVSALVGGLAAAGSASQVKANYEAGARSRLSVLTAATVLLIVGSAIPDVVDVLPVVVVWATLLAVGLLLLDPWSLRSLRDAFFARTRSSVKQGWKNLLVMATVTVITASGAVIGGTLVGIGLSCILFIADMSRSIVRRGYRGDEVLSKRSRPIEDIDKLKQCGRRRAVLELSGVMFFGNADELSRVIGEIFRDADMLALDLAAVDDIDFSAATILRNEIGKGLRHGKTLLLSGASPAALEMISGGPEGLGVPAATVFADVDAALEWMEEAALHQATRAAPTSVPLSEHEFLRGLSDAELAVVSSLLREERYETEQELCHEGDAAAELWILTRGSVSIRLHSGDGRRSRRVASFGMGTVVGEMAMVLEDGKRTATITADVPVECYGLAKSSFRSLLRDRPEIGNKLLYNLLRDSIQRVRTTSDELRAMSR
jgi:MFS superfamily sulfate permease-like transporter